MFEALTAHLPPGCWATGKPPAPVLSGKEQRFLQRGQEDSPPLESTKDPAQRGLPVLQLPGFSSVLIAFPALEHSMAPHSYCYRQWFSTRSYFAPQGTFRNVEIFWVVTTAGCYWRLVGSSQGCCKTACNVQFDPHNKEFSSPKYQ